MSIKVHVYDDKDNERTILVDNYTYHAGRPAVLRGDPDSWLAPEGATIEDVECRWADTQQILSADEYMVFADEIDLAIHEDQMDQIRASLDDAVDSAYERYRERCVG